jgi:hypothetical protein
MPIGNLGTILAFGGGVKAPTIATSTLRTTMASRMPSPYASKLPTGGGGAAPELERMIRAADEGGGAEKKDDGISPVVIVGGVAAVAIAGLVAYKLTR